jgi:uncharacterized protein (TIGR02147 family)
MSPSKSAFHVYSTRDYRRAIDGLVSARKLSDSSMNFRKLADTARVPKSYLSKVLNGSANLSSDQAYTIAKALDLNPDEHEYFLLLLEYERTGLKERRRALLQRIESIQEKYLDTKEHLPMPQLSVAENDQAAYYLMPWAQIVHMGLTISRFAERPKLLQQSLGIDPQEFQTTLRMLEKLRIIGPTSKGYVVNQMNLALPKDSPLYPSWRTQLDMLSASAQLVKRDPKSYGLRVVFSADESTRREIHERFLAFLGDAQKLCEKSNSTQVFQMNFDLFAWTGSVLYREV